MELSDFEESIVEFQTQVGFRAHARVLLSPDPDGPDGEPLLCQLIGPAPPAEQPDRHSRFGPDSFEEHAQTFANDEIPFGCDLINLQVPDGEDVTVVDENAIWEAGRYDIQDPTTGTVDTDVSTDDPDRIQTRDDLEEEEYTLRTKKVIPYLAEGDVIQVSRYGKSYPDIELEVIETSIDPIVADTDGNRYYLRKTHAPNKWDIPQPWLRTKEDNDSAGEISSLTVVDKSDN